jgi:cytochrome c
MDSWEWNKIAGAVLGTLIFVMVLGLFAEAVYHVPTPAKPGYIVEGVKTASTTSKPAAPTVEPLPDFAKEIPAADVAKGQDISQRCAQCHDWAKGGPNKIGPNLWNILGSDRGEGRGGYDFSSAMKTKGGKWTYAELFRFLKHPQVYIPGTKMTFAGIRSAKQRVDLIAFIRTWSDTPYPLPAENAAPADSGKKTKK